MILRPEAKPARINKALVSAWEAVACAEKTRASKYILVRQPDHARVSGEVARHLAITGASPVDDDLVLGITLHDEGWAAFDDGREHLQATPANYSHNHVALNAEGRPLSFLEIKADDFLRAWRGSIDSAEAVAPIAALIVSGHFCRLGKFGISMDSYPDDDAQSVREFLASEEQRQSRLMCLQIRTRTGSTVLDGRTAILRSAFTVFVLWLGGERRVSAAHRAKRRDHQAAFAGRSFSF